MTAAPPLRFGPAGRFLLEPAERRLLVDGQPAALGARALDLLTVLTAEPGHLLTKNELLDRVWPGLVVEEANLQVQISNLRKVLGGETIATVPGRGYRFAAEVAAAAPAAEPAAPAPPAVPGATAVPPANTAPAGPRLVGRGADLERVRALLQAGGCVTLVGPAGVGKTSLARAVAADVPGSVWVDLAALEQGVQLAPALARAVERPLADGSDPLPALRRALAGGERLLVLDNAEHLVQACAELVAALLDLPNLRWLVTSQLPLALPGERVLRLQPLLLEPEAAERPEGYGDGALALLVERIRAADHRFRPTAAQLPLLAEICTRLDGLPLAIEMAAARVPLLGVQGVHDALAERFALLTRGHRNAAPRHRTLHQALAWSYRLLSADEQRLLRDLAVFAGGFTLEMAVTLAAAVEGTDSRWELIDRLAVLVDRSLVVAGAEEPPRYRLMETVRAFGLEQLAELGDLAAARRRHAELMQQLLASVQLGAAVPPQFLLEMENARAAWAWARTEQLALAVEIANAAAVLATFTAWRGECTQWLQALEPAMTAQAGAGLPLALRAAWWMQYARTLVLRADSRAEATARQAVALAREQGDPRRMLNAAGVWSRSIHEPGPALDESAAALQAAAAAVPDISARERLAVQGALSRAAMVRGDVAAALEGRLIEARLARECGWHAAEDAAESNVVNMLNGLRRYEEARRLGRALLARVDQRGGASEGNLPWVLNGLMEACMDTGQLDEALALVPRCVAAGRRFDTPVMKPSLTRLALARRQFEAAARLIGHTRAAYAAHGSAIDPIEVRNLARVEQAVIAALGPEATARLIAEGGTLDDAAVATLAGATPPPATF